MLADIVRQAGRRFGDRPALVTPDRWSLGYRHLDRLSDEAAVGLARRGVGEGTVVSLFLPSTPDYVVAYAALAKLGAITAGVNPALTAAERVATLEVTDPTLILATEALAEGIPSDRDVALTAPGGHPDAVLHDLRPEPGAAPPPLPEDPDRAAAIVLTSGTTGRPKGAWFTGRELVAIARFDGGDRWASVGGAREDVGPPMLASTQFAHVGFTTKLAWYLKRACPLYLLHRWRAAEVLDIVERTRMPSIGGVAPQLALLLRVPDFDRRDFSAVKALIMGGGPSSPALVQEARERFDAAYSIRYSSTESGGVGTATAFDAPDSEALYTVGRPRPGIDLEIRDEDDRPLPHGEIGQVCLRSPAAMRGYWNDPDQSAAVLAGGWLHTGDFGHLDEAGCLRLAGRGREMFVRGGYNVHPMEVEAVLAAHPAVRDVAVVARPDEVMGSIGVAVVVPVDAAAPPSLDDLRSFGGRSLARYKLPETLRVVDALPLTPMHKLDRRALLQNESDGASDTVGRP